MEHDPPTDLAVVSAGSGRVYYRHRRLPRLERALETAARAGHFKESIIGIQVPLPWTELEQRARALLAGETFDDICADYDKPGFKGTVDDHGFRVTKRVPYRRNRQKSG